MTAHGDPREAVEATTPAVAPGGEYLVTIQFRLCPLEYHGAEDSVEGASGVVWAMLEGEADWPDQPPLVIVQPANRRARG